MKLDNTSINATRYIDSLNGINKHLSIKVDSLQERMNIINTKIENFDKITYLQISSFILIVTLIIAIAGFISWRTILITFRIRENNLRRDIINQLNAQNTTFNDFRTNYETQFRENALSQAIIENRSMRALYFHAKSFNQNEIALLWCLRIMQSSRSIDNLERMNLWLDNALDNIKLSFDKEIFEKYFNEMKDIINELKIDSNEDFIKKLFLFRREII